MRSSIFAASFMLLGLDHAQAGSYILVTLNDSVTSTSAAMAINDLNQVAGYDFATASGVAEGFVWSHGVYATASNGGADTRFLAINRRGYVAGQSAGATAATEAFFYAVRTQVFTPVNLSTGLSGYVGGMNNSNDIAGYVVGSGVFANPRGLLTTGRKAGILKFPGAVQSTLAAAVNDSGLVTGTYQKSAGSTHGFTYQAGVYTSFDVPGAVTSFPNAVNLSGVIGGGWSDARYQLHGFIDIAGSFVTLDYPGGSNTVVAALDAAGDAFGNYLDGASSSHAFLYRNGKYVAADYPHAMQTTITAANAAGSYVGYWVDGNFVSHAFAALCPSARIPCAP
jgi:hypothetical protein